MYDKLTQGRAYRKANWEKIKAYQRAWYHKNKRNHKNSQLKSRFNITIREYETLLTKQGGVCAICKERDVNRSLAVDHCHKTKKVRGLLCGRCNRFLGRVEHERGHATLRYLQEHS